MSATAYPAMTSSGQPVLILKEGSSQNRGKEAQRNNIAAAKLISEIVKSSIGPRGMDKMLVDSLGDVTITNDGATMLKPVIVIPAGVISSLPVSVSIVVSPTR